MRQEDRIRFEAIRLKENYLTTIQPFTDKKSEIMAFSIPIIRVKNGQVTYRYDEATKAAIKELDDIIEHHHEKLDYDLQALNRNGGR